MLREISAVYCSFLNIVTASGFVSAFELCFHFEKFSGNVEKDITSYGAMEKLKEACN